MTEIAQASTVRQRHWLLRHAAYRMPVVIVGAFGTLFFGAHLIGALLADTPRDQMNWVLVTPPAVLTACSLLWLIFGVTTSLMALAIEPRSRRREGLAGLLRVCMFVGFLFALFVLAIEGLVHWGIANWPVDVR